MWSIGSARASLSWVLAGSKVSFSGREVEDGGVGLKADPPSNEELARMAELHDQVCPDRKCTPMTYAHLLLEVRSEG